MSALAEIEELMARYCYVHDAQDPNGVAECFASDAVHLNQDGRDGVRTFYEAMYATHEAHRRHVLTNFFMVSENEASAAARATILLYLIKDGQVNLHLTGIYNMSLVVEDGAWKIRQIVADFDVPYNPGDNPLLDRVHEEREADSLAEPR